MRPRPHIRPPRGHEGCNNTLQKKKATQKQTRTQQKQSTFKNHQHILKKKDEDARMDTIQEGGQQ